MTGLVLFAGDVHTLHRWDLRDGWDMPAELRWLVASAEPFAVVRLVGVLDAAAAELVRTALLTFLADQPTAVVVDVGRLAVPDPAALAVFPTAARESSRWPAGRLMLGDPPKAPPGQLGDGLATAPAPYPDSRLDLDPVVGAARLARQFTTERCARWNVAELAEPACIAVTEMVNNVVAHAGTPMALRLRLRAGALQLAVRDHSTGQPSFTGPAAPTSAGGRGLFLIDTVAREWGASTLADGKVVWALVHPEDEPAGPRSRLPARMGG